MLILAGVFLVGAAARVAWAAPPAAAPACQPTTLDSSESDVQDDPALQSAVEWARREFLATQPFGRFSVTVLVEYGGRWIRGSVDGDVLAYPASCVKLPFMLAAVHWCAEHGRSPGCLDASVRPMVVDSDNVATGVVVDTISGVGNRRGPDTALEHWIEMRRYAERVIDCHGLLGTQRLFTKTYPTNSGEEPEGFEKLARERFGPNQMSADAAAALMLAVASGAVEPQATEYMRSLLRRPTFSPHSSLGGGLPPGSRQENKIGTAFDTLQDVMHAELPNGRRLIIAAFTNGWDQGEPEPWDAARLGRFTELLIDRLRLAEGVSPPLYLPARAAGAAAGSPDSVAAVGTWAPRQERGALSTAGYLQSAGAPGESFNWSLDVPRDGRYEIAVWYPATSEQASIAEYRIEHAAGTNTVVLNQQVWGARWIKLGDFDLKQSGGVVQLRAPDGGKLAADTIRLASW